MECFETGFIPGRGEETASSSGMGEFKVPEAMVSILCIDLVKIATKVRCAATGDFIWFGYQPWGREVGNRNNYVASMGIRDPKHHMDQNSRPKHQCVLFNGFKRAGHVDALLKDLCCYSDRFAGGGSCYVRHSVGSCSHASGCCPGQFKKRSSTELLASICSLPGHQAAARSARLYRTMMLPVIAA